MLSNDALKYHQIRATNLFFNRDQPLEVTLDFDVQAFEESATPEPVNKYRFASPRKFDVQLNDEQEVLIQRYLKIYGDSVVGIGRILSKIYVRKLFRHFVNR